jgi:hypothetical protein
MAGDRAVEQASSDIAAYQSAAQLARRGGWRAGPADGVSMPQDRPARGSLAELRLRLERLPAGHPSSPYDDTGAFRPSPQQLRQLELPLADEERDAEPPARASLLAATAGTGGSALSRLSLDAGPSSEKTSNGMSAGAARLMAGPAAEPEFAAPASPPAGPGSRPEPDPASRPDAYRSASGLDAFRTDRAATADGTGAGTSGGSTAGRPPGGPPASDDRAAGSAANGVHGPAAGGPVPGGGLPTAGAATAGMPATETSTPDRTGRDNGGRDGETYDGRDYGRSGYHSARPAAAHADSATAGPAGPESAAYRTASSGRTRSGSAGPDRAPHSTARPDSVPYSTAGPDSTPYGDARSDGPALDSARYGSPGYDGDGYRSSGPGSTAGHRLAGSAGAGYGTDRRDSGYGDNSGATTAGQDSASRDAARPGAASPGGTSRDRAARSSAYGERPAGHSGAYPRPDLSGARTRRPEDRGDGHDTASYRVTRRDPGGRGTVLQGTVLHDTDEPVPGGRADGDYLPAVRNGEPDRPVTAPDGPAAGAPDPGHRPAASGPDPLAPAPPADGTIPRLTTEQDRIADDELERYRVAEGRNVFGGYGENGLTPAMRRVEAQLPHGQLAPDSEQYSLKSPERYKAKLARMVARHPGVPARDLAAEIYDTARFTFVFDPDQYTDGTWMVHRRLKAQGFELEARRNRWESPEAKGIRTRWRDPAQNLAFEVQFHTPASWDVLQRTHEAYLRITDPQTPPDARAQLRARQVAAAAATRPPVRSSEIGDFRGDVR